MTTKLTATLSLFETSTMLRVELGPLRNWTNFLTDNIRGQQSVAGLTLLPCATQSDGKMYRPIYDVDAIKEFIVEVKKRVPSASRTPIRPIKLEINHRSHWRYNKFDRHGKPVPLPKSAPIASSVHLHSASI